VISHQIDVSRDTSPSTAELLAEHARLLQRYGIDSSILYEFEMKYLDNAEFLLRATEQKRRHMQWAQDHVFYRWCWLLIAVLVIFQLGSIIYIVYGRLL
jgi:hypothetical protein